MISLLYDALFAIPLAVATWSFVTLYHDPDGPAITCLVPVLTILVILLLKYLKARGRIIVTGVIISAFLIFILLVPNGERADYLKDHLHLLWFSLVGAGAYVAVALSERWRMIKTVIASLAPAVLVILAICRINVTKACVISVLLFSILTAAELVRGHMSKDHIVFLAPFILAIFIPSIIFKVSDKPYDWGFVKKTVSFIKSEFISIYENFFADNGWDLQGPVIGFSDRAGVGGDLSGTPRDVLLALPTTPSDPKMYLSGKSFDTFTGRSWDKSNTSTIDEKLFDSIETMSAIMDHCGDDVSALARSGGISVEYMDMHTLCMFTPPKTVVCSDVKQVTTLGGDNAFTDKDASRRPYKIEYIRINTNSDEFALIASEEHRVTKESFEAAKQKIGFDVKADYSDYAKYRENIYRYCLPETVISDRAKESIDKVFSGATSDYERLCRLETMFASFGYTISPGDLPENINDAGDFVDNLLFENRKGYCSYYATAFVIIARAYGIPARYAQGYAFNVNGQSKTTVSSMDGHAWPEAYIDGVGWIAFEPTPGQQSDAQKSAWKDDEPYEKPVFYPPTEAGENHDDDKDREGTVIAKIEQHRTQFAISIFAGIAFIVVAFAVAMIVRKIRYDRMSTDEKALYICRRSIERLRRIRLGMNEGETLSEYEKRLSKILPKERIGFIRTYEELLYSKRTATEKECERMESEYRALTKSIPRFMIGDKYDKIK